MTASPSSSVRLLRYRFDTVAQVSRHFHLTSGRVLLFFPALAPLSPGQPVLLHATFPNSDQQCIVRGAVFGKDLSGQFAGCWLEFTAQSVVSSLRSTLATPKRRLLRFPTEVLVSVERPEGMPLLGKLVDVGMGGARIARVGARTTAAQNVRLSFFARGSGARTITARVAWVHGPEIGVEFVRPTPSERTVIAALAEDARQRLADADEAVHPMICRCLEDSAVAEPPLPRAALRLIAST